MIVPLSLVQSTSSHAGGLVKFTDINFIVFTTLPCTAAVLRQTPPCPSNFALLAKQLTCTVFVIRFTNVSNSVDLRCVNLHLCHLCVFLCKEHSKRRLNTTVDLTYVNSSSLHLHNISNAHVRTYQDNIIPGCTSNCTVKARPSTLFCVLVAVGPHLHHVGGVTLVLMRVRNH